MPDITMCYNKECPLRHTCRRYTATPNDMWQAYFDGAWDGEGCEYYMEEESDGLVSTVFRG